MVLPVKQICNVLLHFLLADPTRKFDQLFPPPRAPPPVFSFRIVICLIRRVIFFLYQLRDDYSKSRRIAGVLPARPRVRDAERGAGVCTFSIKSADLELALIDHIPFPFSVTRRSPFPHLTRSLTDPGPTPPHYHHRLHHHVPVIYLIALLSSVYQLPVRAAEAQTEAHSDSHSGCCSSCSFNKRSCF